MFAQRIQHRLCIMAQLYFRGSRSESTLILSALKCNLGNRNFNMAESVAMPEFPFHVCASQSSLTD